MTQPVALQIAFREWFGLTAGEADILVMLFDAEGRPLGTQHLMHRTGLKRNNIHWHVHRLRTALETEAIDHVKGDGYRLTEGGREECRAAAWTISQELAQVR